MSRSSVQQIIWAVEGDPSTGEFLRQLDCRRNIVVFNSRRLGKAAAYNNVFDLINGELVFLISSDVLFDPQIFEKVESYFKNYDLLIPSVRASHTEGPIRKVSNLLWEIRNTELRFLNSSGSLIHGGEFVAVRKKFLSRIPDVVNEDAMQCICAQQNGARVIYAEDVVIRNFLPSKLSDFIAQRRRINFGYIQLKRMGFRPNVLSFMVTEDFVTFATIMKMFISEHKRKVLLLIVLGMIEIFSRILSTADYISGREHKFWKVISTSKS